jgi:protein-S-isoprenylcysteine O-methyltransferase Ste14
MRVLENRIPPLIVALLCAAGMWTLARWWPLWKFEFSASLPAGLVVASFGFVLCILGALEFWRAKTSLNPFHPKQATSLVTTGIYRFTRNPIYLGFLFALLGCFLVFEGLSAFFSLPVFTLYITRFQIQPEERALRAKFGSAYTEYQVRVRRWL